MRVYVAGGGIPQCKETQMQITDQTFGDIRRLDRSSKYMESLTLHLADYTSADYDYVYDNDYYCYCLYRHYIVVIIRRSNKGTLQMFGEYLPYLLPLPRLPPRFQHLWQESSSSL